MSFSGYAARLNSFKINTDGYWSKLNSKPSTLDLIRRAATVKGLTAVDLNFPDHLEGQDARDLIHSSKDCGIALNGFAMRYYSGDDYKRGAFTHPDPAIRRKAIDLTKQGLDTLAEVGGSLMTLWMGQDGFDYAFQIDYGAAWDHTIAAYAELCDHNRNIDISIEYKPNEPRSFSLMPDVATTLLAVKDIGRKNLGVTLDFAHVLYADEMPAYAATLVQRYSRLLGIHLNDGYGKRDDGLIAGSVHPVQTVELLVAMLRMNYKGIVYFDTFPDTAGLDPLIECATNIAATDRMIAIAQSLATRSDLAAAIERQDAATSQRIVLGDMLHAR
jgi:xylose isomerase